MRPLITLLLCFVLTTCKAQTPADILRNFPAKELLQTINNLQTDLKNCEQTNAKIIQEQAITNDKLTRTLNLTQNNLMYQLTRADSLSNRFNQIQLLSKAATKDIKKAKVWLFIDKFKIPIAVGGTAFTTYFITKNL